MNDQQNTQPQPETQPDIQAVFVSDVLGVYIPFSAVDSYVTRDSGLNIYCNKAPGLDGYVIKDTNEAARFILEFKAYREAMKKAAVMVLEALYKGLEKAKKQPEGFKDFSDWSEIMRRRMGGR